MMLPFVFVLRVVHARFLCVSLGYPAGSPSSHTCALPVEATVCCSCPQASSSAGPQEKESNYQDVVENTCTSSTSSRPYGTPKMLLFRKTRRRIFHYVTFMHHERTATSCHPPRSHQIPAYTLNSPTVPKRSDLRLSFRDTRLRQRPAEGARMS